MNEHIITTEGICCCNCGGDYTRMDGITVDILHKTISFKCTVCGQINHKGAPIATTGLTTPAQAVVIGKAIAKLEIPAWPNWPDWPDWADAKPIASGTITADKINFAQVTGSITADKINPAQVTTIMKEKRDRQKLNIYQGVLEIDKQCFTGIEKTLNHSAVFRMQLWEKFDLGTQFNKVLEHFIHEFEADLKHECYVNNKAAVQILTEIYRTTPSTIIDGKIGRYLLTAISGKPVTFSYRGVTFSSYKPSMHQDNDPSVPEMRIEWVTRPKQEYVVTFRDGKKKSYPNAGKAIDAIVGQVGWKMEHICG